MHKYGIMSSRKIKLFFYETGRHFELSQFNAPVAGRIPDGQIQAFEPLETPLVHADNELFEIVTDPARSDFFVFPFLLRSLINRLGLFGDSKSFAAFNNKNGNAEMLAFLRKLPYFEKFPERHIFSTDHDWDGPYGVSSVIINTSISKNNPNPHQICIPFSIADIPARAQRNEISHFSNFIGYVGSHPIRIQLMENLLPYIEKGKRLPIYLKFNTIFHPHASGTAKIEKRAEFLDVMLKSATALCPRGTGLNSARFYETMCMGRIPILISDDCVLPLEDEIDWDSLILRIPQEDLVNIGPRLEELMSSLDRTRVLRMCLANRLTWEQHFQPSRIQNLYHRQLMKILSSL